MCERARVSIIPWMEIKGMTMPWSSIGAPYSRGISTGGTPY